MTTKVKVRRLDTTVGELVAAIMDAALSVNDNEHNAYRLTGFMLNRILRPVPEVAARRAADAQRIARLRY